jgi:hypothetical protein
MKNAIATNIKADTDEFDLKMMLNPKWRAIDKKRWMSQTNQFFFKKCDKPCWNKVPGGFGDGSVDPHIIDDSRQLP